MFKESDIPPSINKLKAFKKWRMMGQKLLGAVMLGLIEYLIRRRSSLLEKEILIIPQQNRQLIELIKSSSKFDSQQRVKYIYTELEIMDKRNYHANELAQAYLQKKGVQIQPTNEETQMKHFASEFNISIQIHSQTIQKYHGKVDVTSLIFYELERNYYFILKIAEECMHCFEKAELVKLKCDHNICKSCLEKFFGTSKISSVKCEEQGCSYNISKEFYQQTVNKSVSKIQTQQSQIIKEYTCSMCNLKQTKESILNLSCKHNLCKPCIIKHIQNAKTFKQSCLMLQCSGKFIMEDLTELKKTLTYSEKQNLEQTSKIIQKKEATEQNIQMEQKGESNLLKQKNEEEANSRVKVPTQKTDSKIQTKENTAEVKQLGIGDELSTIQNQKCSRCKGKGFGEMYKSNCQHYYCEQCYDILNQEFISFNCQEYGCGSYINEDKIQFIGTKEQKIKEQKELGPKKCSRCYKKLPAPELFCTPCCHFICVTCIEYLANRKVIYCPYCKNKLDESSIEEYYLEQQTQLLKRISVEEQTNSIPKEQTFEYQYVEKLNECECCHSPFTEYNIQQDLTCHNHSIGTCCIVFPVDCPKCQLGSITIHKSRLKFELQVMEEEFTN